MNKYRRSYLKLLSIPYGHMTFRQRHINVDATSWPSTDVDVTLSQRCVPARYLGEYLYFSFVLKKKDSLKSVWR